MADSVPPSTVRGEAGSPESLHRVRPAITFGFFNAMTWQVALGTPMVMFAERLGASALAVGVAYSFVFLLTPVQVLSTALLPRYGYKRMMLSGWGARSLFLLPAIAIAWMAPATGTTSHVAIFIGSLFLFTLFRSVGSCAWLPWINSLLTTENRGRYFASDQAMSGLAGVGTLLVCWFSLRVMPLYDAFLLQYSFAFVGSWFAYVSLSRLPDAPKPSAMSLRYVVRGTPQLMAQPGPFRNFVLIGVLVGVAVAAIPPFCAYYLKVGPELSAAKILLFTTIQYSGVIATAYLIRNHVDRTGARLFFQLSLLMYVAIAVFWIALLRGWAGGIDSLPVVYFALGCAASCWAAANMKYLPQVVDEEHRALAFSVHAAVTSVASGIAAAVWGGILKGSTDQPSMNVPAFQGFFLATLISAAVLALLIRRLPASAGPAADWTLGGLSLRPFRGFTYLASLVLPTAGADRRAATGSSGAQNGERGSPK